MREKLYPQLATGERKKHQPELKTYLAYLAKIWKAKYDSLHQVFLACQSTNEQFWVCFKDRSPKAQFVQMRIWYIIHKWVIQWCFAYLWSNHPAEKGHPWCCSMGSWRCSMCFSSLKPSFLPGLLHLVPPAEGQVQSLPSMNCDDLWPQESTLEHFEVGGLDFQSDMRWWGKDSRYCKMKYTTDYDLKLQITYFGDSENRNCIGTLRQTIPSFGDVWGSPNPWTRQLMSLFPRVQPWTQYDQYDLLNSITNVSPLVINHE